MYVELQRIRAMSLFLKESSVKCLVSAFMFSKMDYCNSLLVNLSSGQLQRIQKFQNLAAKLITRRPKREHVTPLLIHLHWLPVKARIEFKIATLCFKCMNNKAPSYLKNLLNPYQPVRSLRSSTQNLLIVPKTNLKKFGNRSFAYNAATIWNSLPHFLKSISNEATFKAHLKTYLFQAYLL